MSYRMPVSCGDRLDLAICPDSTKVIFKVFNSNSHTLNLAEVYIVVLAVVKPGVADVLVPGSSAAGRPVHGRCLSMSGDLWSGENDGESGHPHPAHDDGTVMNGAPLCFGS